MVIIRVKQTIPGGPTVVRKKDRYGNIVPTIVKRKPYVRIVKLKGK